MDVRNDSRADERCRRTFRILAFVFIFIISIFNHNHRWHSRLRLFSWFRRLYSCCNLLVLLDGNILLVILLGSDGRIRRYSRGRIGTSGRNSDRLVVDVERVELLVDISFADLDGGVLLGSLGLVRKSGRRRIFFAAAGFLICS